MNAIYVVIVLYKIDLFEARSYQTLIAPNQITDFLVYDNSPQEGYTDTSKLPDGATYIHDKNNSGLSAAYNRGAQIAKEKGFQRVLLLDQDTYFEPGVWQAYLENADYAGITAPIITTEGQQAVPFSPVKIDGLFKRAEKMTSAGEYSLYQYAVVNSGCCVPTHLFLQCGGYDPRVTLDFSDFQFQLRLRKHFPKFLLLNAHAVQDFSNDCTDVSKIKARFALYLKSARYFQADGHMDRFKHQCEVLKHIAALTLRTHSLYFLKEYISKYL